jgi:hypothetical protein
LFLPYGFWKRPDKDTLSLKQMRQSYDFDQDLAEQNIFSNERIYLPNIRKPPKL